MVTVPSVTAAQQSTDATRPGAVRPGGRTARVRAAVFAAALDELGRHGYAALSVEQVAAAAGVHKTTVYRRWPTKDRLVAEALADRVDAAAPIPDTGAVADDLRALARSVVALLRDGPGAATAAALFSDAGRVPEIAAMRHELFVRRHDQAAVLVERGVARGELPAGTDPRGLLELVMAPVWYRLLVTGEPVDASVADRAVEVALIAARASALVRPTG